MLLGNQRYQGGNDGCSPDRMLLRTRRFQVGSHGGSSIADAVSKLACMDVFAIRLRMLWKPESFNWHAWMLSLFDHGCYGNRKVSIGMHGCCCYSIANRGQRRRSPGARTHHRETFRNSEQAFIKVLHQTVVPSKLGSSQVGACLEEQPSPPRSLLMLVAGGNIPKHCHRGVDSMRFSVNHIYSSYKNRN